MNAENIREIESRIYAGGSITEQEAYDLAKTEGADLEELYEAAHRITKHFGSPVFDSCSIINARSGKCSEDCKWCAQSAHYSTNVECYPLVDHDVCMEMADYNCRMGIRRFSLVTSGRAMSGRTMEKVCGYYREISDNSDLYLCASMGLLSDEDMKALHEAGCKRYHCNMETAPSFFPTLCSTHTQADKMKVIEAARREGMEICSGGIIGMGETMDQRVEFALFLKKEVDPVSIPLNILHPIPGTPLEHQAPLSDEEVLKTVAVFRFVHPKIVLRFAGGRDTMSPELQRKSIYVGVNGSIMGDLLTTVGSKIADDKKMVEEMGYQF